MDLHLQAAAPAGGGQNPAAGKQEGAVSSSDFSRLLARHVGRAGEKASAEELPRPDDRNETADETAGKQRCAENHDSRSESRPGGEAPETRGRPGENDASPASPTGMAPGSAENSLSPALLTGFLTMADPLGNLSFADPAASPLEVVPAEVRARLAGDIATGFTNRGGVQTLTLNLEPEHLGKVDVRMRAEGDRLSVRILAATREAESALRENVKDLADTIRDRTGKYQQVDVRIELKSGDGRETGASGRDRADDDSRRDESGRRQDNPDRQDGRGGQEFAEDGTASRHGKQEG